MTQTITVHIYGDSLMKGTVLDAGRYHSVIGAKMRAFGAQYGLTIVNRARFGSTVEQGLHYLQKDLSAGLHCDYALLEFGGNDCDFRWAEVAAAPAAAHEPLTPPAQFRKLYRHMLSLLRQAGIKPLMMNLPPLLAERYLDFVSQKGGKQEILQWLGDSQMIYRFQEWYSAMVDEIAADTHTALIDVRRLFLPRHDLSGLICADGIHPADSGYDLFFAAAGQFVESLRGQMVLTPTANLSC